MSDEAHIDRQRRFYERRAHRHLQARADDLYARNLVDHVVDELGIAADGRVLELGAGFGRFTFPLLERCGSVVAADLSPVALMQLSAERDARGIPARRCTTLTAAVDDLTADSLGERFDWIVGFFLLHHLPDYAGSIRRVAALLSKRGRVGFIEPNRRNPLFLLQVMACPDMTWAEEKGMFSLSRRGVEAAYRDAGLAEPRTHRLGFFPPQIFNRFRLARSLEATVERFAPTRGILPFLLLSARAAHRVEAER